MIMKVDVTTDFIKHLRSMGKNATTAADTLNALKYSYSDQSITWKSEANKNKWISSFRKSACDAINEMNVCLYLLTGKTLDIDIDELIKDWKG